MHNAGLITILGFGLSLAASPLKAAPLSVAAWQRAVLTKPEGDAMAGKALYADKGCAACHGAAGVPDNRDMPVLAGQRPLYLYKMLLDYKAGRVGGGETMSGMAALLDESGAADIAAWLSTLPRPPASRVAAAPTILQGDRQRLLPPCEACHGANGQGWDVQPAIAGQNPEFLGKVLNQFKQGTRGNDLNGGMSIIAAKLSEQELRELVDYFGR